MRVAELVGLREVRVVERPLEDPEPGEVQVRVEAVGICGSDMHSYAEGGVGDTPCAYPMVLGHEPAGVVARVGPGVTGLAPGDRAAFEPAVFCYHCPRCLEGRHNLCERLRFLSMPGEPGFLRERVNLPAANVLPLPPELSTDEGALVEPLAVVLHSLAFVGPAVGMEAAVLGAGPIGLLTVAALRLAGARRIWVVEPLAHRGALALAMGADAALDSAPDGAATNEILAATGRAGVDVVLDCAAKGDSAGQALALARAGGRVVFTGIPTEIEVPLPFHRWRRKELALFQVRRSNHEARAALDLLRRERARFAPLLTHRRPLGAIAEAFSLCERYADGLGKMIVRVSE
jgi:L-iditol 2-dehydrogenase